MDNLALSLPVLSSTGPPTPQVQEAGRGGGHTGSPGLARPDEDLLQSETAPNKKSSRTRFCWGRQNQGRAQPTWVTKLGLVSPKFELRSTNICWDRPMSARFRPISRWLIRSVSKFRAKLAQCWVGVGQSLSGFCQIRSCRGQVWAGFGRFRSGFVQIVGACMCCRLCLLTVVYSQKPCSPNTAASQQAVVEAPCLLEVRASWVRSKLPNYPRSGRRARHAHPAYSTHRRRPEQIDQVYALGMSGATDLRRFY